MIYLITMFFILSFVAGLVFIIKKSNEFIDFIIKFFILVILQMIVVIPLCVFILYCTEGLYRGYGDGIQDGFITRISEKGIIWKTFEIESQVNIGDVSSLQKPRFFSIPKEKTQLIEQATALIDKKVRIGYVEWLIAPFSIGDSKYELTKLEALE